MVYNFLPIRKGDRTQLSRVAFMWSYADQPKKTIAMHMTGIFKRGGPRRKATGEIAILPQGYKVRKSSQSKAVGEMTTFSKSIRSSFQQHIRTYIAIELFLT